MKLEDWFKLTKRPKGDFAREIGVTPQMISAYIKGDVWPKQDRMKRIAELTDGAVTANDFLGGSQ